MEFSLTFLHVSFWGLYLISPILLLLIVTITVLGLAVGRIESWHNFDALYWAFITALTVGYGDIRPKNKSSRVLSIFIAMLGIIFAGILVAVTVEAASSAFKIHVDTETLERIKR